MNGENNFAMDLRDLNEYGIAVPFLVRRKTIMIF